MTSASVRKVAALVFALVVAGGSVAGAAGPKDYGECRVGTVQTSAVSLGK